MIHVYVNTYQIVECCKAQAAQQIRVANIFRMSAQLMVIQFFARPKYHVTKFTVETKRFRLTRMVRSFDMLANMLSGKYTIELVMGDAKKFESQSPIHLFDFYLIFDLPLHRNSQNGHLNRFSSVAVRL